MSNPPNLTESMDHLVKIISKTAISSKDKTDAYLAMSQHLRSDMHSAEQCLQKHTSKLLELLKVHIKSSQRKQTELALAALLVLGYVLSSPNLAKIPSETLMSGVLADICDILQSPKDKQFYVRSFWLLANQHIPNHILSKHTSAVISCVIKHSSSATNSGTVVAQGIQTIKRLCEMCPAEMEVEIEKCIDIVFNELSTSPASFKVTMDVVIAIMPVLCNKETFSHEYVVKKLNEGLGNKAKTFFKEGLSFKFPVIRMWICFSRLLGVKFWRLNHEVKGSMTSILVEGFKSKDKDVLFLVYDMWSAFFIDGMLSDPGLFQKRKHILLEPLKSRYHHHENHAIAEKCLKTYWYMICKIGGKLNEDMDNVVLPILEILFSSPLDAICGGKSNATTPVCVTPTKTNTTVTKLETPKSVATTSQLTPKSPSRSPPLRMLAIEMLCVLLSSPEERKTLKGTKLEPFFGPKISSNHILNHSSKFVGFLLEGSRSCMLVNDTLVIQCWVSFLFQMKGLDGTDFKKAWGIILSALKEIVDEEVGTVNFILRISVLLPFTASYKELTCKGNSNGFTALFILQSILNEQFIAKKIHESEKFFVLYQRMIEVLFCGVSGQLSSADTILSCLGQSNSFLNDSQISWRLWSTLTHIINRYVSMTNEVNRGNAAKYDFSIVLKSLFYPIEFIDFSNLTEGLKDNLMDSWSELYETFDRAISLVPGIKDHLILEEFCLCMMEYCKKDTKQSLDVIMRMLWVVAKSATFDFTSKKSGTVTFLQGGDPIGSFTYFLKCLQLIVTPMMESQEQASRNTDKYMFEIMDMIQYFYEQLTGYSQLYRTTELLSSTISGLFEKYSNSHSKLTSYLEKLMESIYTSFEKTPAVEFGVDLLKLFEPFIVHAALCKRKQMRVRAVQFWNHTFGKNESLTYSSVLRDALVHSKTPMKAIVGGSISAQNIVNDCDENTQYPDSLSSSSSMLQSPSRLKHASPVKVMGSFLQTHKRDDLKASPIKLSLYIKSPSKTKSPVKTPPSTLRSKKGGRRKLPINEEFVEIKEAPKKSRLLTEHQKEVRREKKTIPLMYNTLDQSQDTTLFQAMTQDSNSQPQKHNSMVIPEDASQNNSCNIDFAKCDGSVPGRASTLVQHIPLTMKEDENLDMPRPVSILVQDIHLTTKDDENLDMPRPVSTLVQDIHLTTKDDENLDMPRPVSTLVQDIHLTTKEGENLDMPGPVSTLVEHIPITPTTKDDAKFMSTGHTSTLVEMSPVEEEEEDRDFIPSSQTQESFSQLRSPYVDNNQPSKIAESPEEQLVTISAFQGLVENTELKHGDVKKSDETPKRNVSEIKKENNKENSFVNNECISKPLNIDLATFTQIAPHLANDSVLKSANIEKDSKTGGNWLSTNSLTKTKKQPKGKSSVRRKSALKDDLDASIESDIKKAVQKRTPVTLKRKRKASSEGKIPGRKKTRSTPESPKMCNTSEIIVNSVKIEQDFFNVDDNITIADLKKSLPRSKKIGEKNSLYSFMKSKKCNVQVKMEDVNCITLKGEDVENVDLRKVNEKSVNESIVGETVPSDHSNRFGDDVCMNEEEKRLEVGEEEQEKEGSNSVELIENYTIDTSHNTEALTTSVTTASSESSMSSSTSTSTINCDVTLESKDNIVNTSLNLDTSANTTDLNKSDCRFEQITTSMCFSPKSKVTTPTAERDVKNSFFSNVYNSPKGIVNIPSPLASPASGILKKWSFAQSPSPPNKNRRVSFQLPEGVLPLKSENNETLLPRLPPVLEKEKEKIPLVKVVKQKPKKSDGECIYPDLIACTMPIEKILPSITFSRGVGHLVRAQNILTVGDLSSLSEAQVENLPIRSPKLRTVKNALKSFSAQQSRQRVSLKSPLSLGSSSALDFSSPQKDHVGDSEADALMVTPSKHVESIKPTALFSGDKTTIKSEPKSPTPLVKEPEKDEVGLCSEVNVAPKSVQSSDQVLPENKKEPLNEAVDVDNKTDVVCEGIEIQCRSEVPSDHDAPQTDVDNVEDITHEGGASVAKEKDTHEKPIAMEDTHEKSIAMEENAMEDLPANQSLDEVSFENMDCVDQIKVILEEATDKGKQILDNMPKLGDNNDLQNIITLAECSRKLASNSTASVSSDVSEINNISLRKISDTSEEIIDDFDQCKVDDTVLKEKENNPSEVNDSFESAFAAGDISPIKNGVNKDSFFETSVDADVDVDVDAIDKEEGRNDDIAIDGITPLVNDSMSVDCVENVVAENTYIDNAKTTNINETCEYSTSQECVPSSVVNTTDVGESMFKTCITSSISSTAQQSVKTIIPDTCSINVEETFASCFDKEETNGNVEEGVSSSCIVSSNAGVSLLPHIDLSVLPTTDIFKLVHELDKLKSKVMGELRTRMLGQHKKTS